MKEFIKNNKESLIAFIGGIVASFFFKYADYADMFIIFALTMFTLLNIYIRKNQLLFNDRTKSSILDIDKRLKKLER